MKYLLAAFLITFSCSVFADSWRCTAEKSTGFDADWKFKVTNFMVRGQYTIRPGTSSDFPDWQTVPRYVILPAGSSQPIAWSLDEISPDGYLFLGGPVYNVRFDVKRLRYTAANSGDLSVNKYPRGGPKTDPGIEIGSCVRSD